MFFNELYIYPWVDGYWLLHLSFVDLASFRMAGEISQANCVTSHVQFRFPHSQDAPRPCDAACHNAGWMPDRKRDRHTPLFSHALLGCVYGKPCATPGDDIQGTPPTKHRSLITARKQFLSLTSLEMLILCPIDLLDMNEWVLNSLIKALISHNVSFIGGTRLASTNILGKVAQHVISPLKGAPAPWACMLADIQMNLTDVFAQVALVDNPLADGTRHLEQVANRHCTHHCTQEKHPRDMDR